MYNYPKSSIFELHSKLACAVPKLRRVSAARGEVFRMKVCSCCLTLTFQAVTAKELEQLSLPERIAFCEKVKSIELLLCRTCQYQKEDDPESEDEQTWFLSPSWVEDVNRYLSDLE